jgi:toxin ParE1/3/4
MAKFELSQAADSDLNEIYIYSYREFGEVTADAYLLSLDQCFQNLAEFPGLGRSIGHIRSGYFRFPHASHVVFFVEISDGIRIIRVLHQRMDPERHIRD